MKEKQETLDKIYAGKVYGGNDAQQRKVEEYKKQKKIQDYQLLSTILLNDQADEEINIFGFALENPDFKALVEAKLLTKIGYFHPTHYSITEYIKIFNLYSLHEDIEEKILKNFCIRMFNYIDDFKADSDLSNRILEIVLSRLPINLLPVSNFLRRLEHRIIWNIEAYRINEKGFMAWERSNIEEFFNIVKNKLKVQLSCRLNERIPEIYEVFKSCCSPLRRLLNTIEYYTVFHTDDIEDSKAREFLVEKFLSLKITYGLKDRNEQLIKDFYNSNVDLFNKIQNEIYQEPHELYDFNARLGIPFIEREGLFDELLEWVKQSPNHLKAHHTAAILPIVNLENPDQIKDVLICGKFKYLHETDVLSYSSAENEAKKRLFNAIMSFFETISPEYIESNQAILSTIFSQWGFNNDNLRQRAEKFYYLYLETKIPYKDSPWLTLFTLEEKNFLYVRLLREHINSLHLIKKNSFLFVNSNLLEIKTTEKIISRLEGNQVTFDAEDRRHMGRGSLKKICDFFPFHFDYFVPSQDSVCIN